MTYNYMNTQPEANLSSTEDFIKEWRKELSAQKKEFHRAIEELYRVIKRNTDDIKEEQKKNVEQLQEVIKQFKI